MPSYKLTYFNFRGRAELIRLLFAAADVEYEDVRFEREQWPQIKPTTPFGQAPILEVDGVTLCQSYTIARFLARRFNLAGKTDLEQVRADMLVDCFEDIVKTVQGFMIGQDEEVKAAKKVKFIEEQLPVFLENLDKLLQENKRGDGFFVGHSLTWADLDFITLVDLLTVVGADQQVAKYPKLFALKQRVTKLPRIAAWIAKRPTTDF